MCYIFILSMLALLQQNAKAGTSLDRKQLRHLTRLSEAFKECAASDWHAFINEDPCGNLMQIYGNDGTPVRAKVHLTRNLSGETFSRKAHLGTELLVQAAFLRRRTAGDLHTRALLTDPLPLTEGKTAKAILACSLQM